MKKHNQNNTSFAKQNLTNKSDTNRSCINQSCPQESTSNENFLRVQVLSACLVLAALYSMIPVA